MRSPVVPADVIAAAESVCATLGAAVDRPWTMPAGTLTWPASGTVAHVAGAIAKYSVCLASRRTQYLVLQAIASPDASNADLLEAVRAAAAALATVADATPVSARGFHVAGMADAEGFCAMACAELLVHGWDAASGLGVAFAGDEDVAGRVVARLFPWAADASRGGLLDLTGRRAPADPDWMWHAAPLEEWDGVTVARLRMVKEWVRGDDGRWTAMG